MKEGDRFIIKLYVEAHETQPNVSPCDNCECTGLPDCSEYCETDGIYLKIDSIETDDF